MTPILVGIAFLAGGASCGGYITNSLPGQLLGNLVGGAVLVLALVTGGYI